MRPFLLAALVALAAPAGARAEATLVARDVPLRGARALAQSASLEFDLVGLHWRGAGSVEFRTRSVERRWSSWHPAAPEAEDLPDRPVQPGWRIGNPFWTGPSDRIAYRLHGRVLRLRAYFVHSPSIGVPPRRLSIAGSPAIVTRSSWGADESIRRAPPRYADAVHFAVVHHTAGTNSYSPSQSAAIVRGIEVYHVKGNGWDDIGYNLLVDRYGQVFEGRYGGIDRAVIGAHAEGFNTGSTGVALLGSYGSAQPTAAARAALAAVLAWRLDMAHVDPLSTVTWASGGSGRFPAGTPVLLRAVSGHRDTGFTSCPGNALYAQLGALAQEAAAIGLPKLYAVSVAGELGGLVRFRARLSTELPWTVTVTDAAGGVVASGAGSGTDVDWSWDSTLAAKARYTYSIAAGADVLPAPGSVGVAPVALAIKTARASPTAISPDGDGQQDRSVISYTLTTAAKVTATLRAPGGATLATLFSAQRRAGRQTFTFTAENVADGRYEIVLAADDGIATVSVVVPVLVDRTVNGFAASPPAFSPNGDGRLDDVMFAFRLVRDATQVRLEIRRAGKLVAGILSGALTAERHSVGWDGTTAAGVAPDGTYAAVLTATSRLGSVIHSLRLRIDTRPPALRAVSFRGLRFSLGERAQLRLIVNGRAIRVSAPAGAVTVPFRGRVRSVRVTATDAAGNVSRTLRYR